MYTYITSSLDFLPIYVTTEHWVEFPVLSSHLSLVICFISSRVHMSITISQFIPTRLLTPQKFTYLFSFTSGSISVLQISPSILYSFSQFSSVAQSCLTLCNPMDCNIPGFPVHHQLPELAQTQLHQVSDAIQPFHPLASPYPPTFNLSHHQGLFQWVSSSHQVAKYWSFRFSISPSSECSGLISFRTDWFDLLAVKGLSRVFSNTTVQKHQFFGAQPSL